MNHRIYNGMQNILSVIVKTVGLVITESFHYLTIACCFFQPLEQLKYSHLRAPKPTPVLLISYIPKIFLHPFLVPCYWLKGLEHPGMALTLKYRTNKTWYHPRARLRDQKWAGSDSLVTSVKVWEKRSTYSGFP